MKCSIFAISSGILFLLNVNVKCFKDRFRAEIFELLFIMELCIKRFHFVNINWKIFTSFSFISRNNLNIFFYFK